MNRGRMPIRYFTGYILLLGARLLRKCAEWFQLLAFIPEGVVMIIWTPREIDRHARSVWNSWKRVRRVSALSSLTHGLSDSERDLFARHDITHGDVLVLACGAGREALALARQGFRVTACDWSPDVIDVARREAQRADLSVQFDVADLYDLHYAKRAFDYVLLTNVGYSLLTPRRRRIHFLNQARSFLKPGGLFVLSFAAGGETFFSHPLRLRLHRLASKLTRHAPFNQEYEPGDLITDGGLWIHYFLEEGALKDEFAEAGFDMKELLWEEGFAVLTSA